MEIVVEHVEEVKEGFEVTWYLDEVKDHGYIVEIVSYEKLKDFFEAEEYGVGFEDKFSYTSGHYTIDWNIPFEDYIEDSTDLKVLITDYLSCPD